jgi:hypothetical protein
MCCEDNMSNITDADLLAYIDGAVSPETARRIEGAPELLERARGLARQEAALHARLFRAECPDAHQLGEYQLGLLAASQEATVHQHVESCPRCLEELRQLEEFLRPGLLDQVRVIAAQLLSGGPGVRSQPALGVRGEAAAPRIYTAGDLQIVLETQADPRRPERPTLSGLVVGFAGGEMEARLFAGDQPAGDAPVGDLGEFAFPGLTPGTYALRLYTAEEEIHIPPFSIDG